MVANPDDFTEYAAPRVGVRPPPGDTQASHTVWGADGTETGPGQREVDKALALPTYKCRFCPWSTIFPDRVGPHEQGCEKERAEFDRREAETQALAAKVSGGITPQAIQAIVNAAIQGTAAVIMPSMERIAKVLDRLVPESEKPHKPKGKVGRPRKDGSAKVHSGKTGARGRKSRIEVAPPQEPVASSPEEPGHAEPTA